MNIDVIIQKPYNELTGLSAATVLWMQDMGMLRDRRRQHSSETILITPAVGQLDDETRSQLGWFLTDTSDLILVMSGYGDELLVPFSATDDGELVIHGRMLVIGRDERGLGIPAELICATGTNGYARLVIDSAQQQRFDEVLAEAGHQKPAR